MNTKVLQYCIDLAKYKNFTRVAEKHYISQQALSVQIKNLERELGVELFSRTKRSVEVTSAGKGFIAEAQKTLAHLEAAYDSARNPTRNSKLALGCSGIVIQAKLGDVIYSFTERYPDVSVEIRTPSDDDEFPGEADLFTAKDLEAYDPAFYECMDYPMGQVMAVVGAQHPLAKYSEVTAQQLLNEEFIFHAKKTDPKLMAKRKARVNKLLGSFPPRVIEIDNRETADMLVRCGKGFMLLGKEAAALHNSDQIVYIPIKGVTEGFPFWLVWRKYSTNPNLHNFLEIINEVETE